MDGSAIGYRPTRTLTFRTELRRQASRRRTQLALGFMVALPLIILILYFRAKGGYKAQVLTGHAAEDKEFTGGVEAGMEA